MKLILKLAPKNIVDTKNEKAKQPKEQTKTADKPKNKSSDKET